MYVLKRLFILIFVIHSVACGDNNPQTNGNLTLDKRTKELEQLKRTKISRDGSQVNKNLYKISYVAVDEPIVVLREKEVDVSYQGSNKTKTVVTAPSNEGKSVLTANKETTEKKPIKVDRNMKIRYLNFGSDMQKDRPPLFDKSCLTKEVVATCTEAAIDQYIKSNMVLPKVGNDGYETVIFVVDKTGNVSPNIKVATKEKACEACEAAAVAVIANMPKWLPALENGRPVSAEVTLPIKFDFSN